MGGSGGAPAADTKTAAGRSQSVGTVGSGKRCRGSLRRKGYQHALSATGSGERCSRAAREADTGHWSATDLVTLAGTGALECQPKIGTGQTWALSATV